MRPIDLSLALKAADGDFELLQVVVEAFLEEYPTLLADLERAIPAGNTEVVQRASHTIKGALRLFGNIPPRDFAERLEEMAASGSLTNAMETYESLKLSLATFRQQLLEYIEELANPE